MSAIHAHEGSYRNHLDRVDVPAGAAAVGPRTAAILPVHLDGQLCDMPALSRRAVPQGITLLPDVAQAHGARCDGRPVSTPKPLPHAEPWEAEELLLPMSPVLECYEVKRAADACGSAVEDRRGPDLPAALAAKAHA
jgi:dTDP-4-amino-4,6-dideoxygalactose transaminase